MGSIRLFLSLACFGYGSSNGGDSNALIIPVVKGDKEEIQNTGMQQT